MLNVRELRALLDKYTEHGLTVLPLRYGDKRPLGEWRYLLELPEAERVTTAREVFLRHAEQRDWKLNIGLLCDGIFVLDVDNKEAFAQWLRRRGVALPATTAVQTRRGVHYYFRVPQGYGVIKGGRRQDLGADIKGWGGYVVAPPSVVLHADGHHVYRFLVGLEALQEPTDWVLELLERERVHADGAGEHVRQEIARLLLPYWQEGVRHELALGLAGLLRRHGIPETDALACVSMLALEAGDNELRNRLDAVRDTYRKPADEVAGAKILLQQLGAEVVERLEGLLSGGRKVRLLTFAEWEQREAERMAGVWLVEGVLRQGDLAILGGRPKAGKSMVAVSLAHALETGTPWLGLGTARCGVLYLDHERPRETVRRLRALGAGEGIYTVDGEVTAADLPALRSAVEEVASRCGGLVVVIVDTLADFVGRLLARRRATLNDYDAVAQELQRLRWFLAETGATLVAVHHTGKLGAGTGDERELLGTTAIPAKADVVLQLYRETDAEGIRRLHIYGNAVEEQTLYFTVRDDFRLERCDSPERTKVARAARVIREFLQAEGERTRQDIVRHLQAVFGIGDSAAQKLFERAAGTMDGELYKRHNGGKLVYGVRNGLTRNTEL